MKTEQAIKLLHRLQDEQFDGIHGDERREALEMAVRALSGDGDTISRQQAIEAFEPTHYIDWYTPIIIETLEALPSVQPDYKTDHGYMWLCPHCGLPVHSDFEECLRCGTKRQSAQLERKNQKTALSVQVKVDFDDMKVLLEDIGKLQTYKLFVGDDMVLVDVEDIKDILAKHVKAKEVQSQRNTGKWKNHRKDDGHNIADCDQCGNAIQWFDGDEIPRYCCMCGADMRGESDED